MGNGRGSGSPTTLQPGRNPICEQSDVFFNRYSLDSHGDENDNRGGHADPSFLVAPCPTGIQDNGEHRNNNDNGNDNHNNNR